MDRKQVIGIEITEQMKKLFLEFCKFTDQNNNNISYKEGESLLFPNSDIEFNVDCINNNKIISYWYQIIFNNNNNFQTFKYYLHKYNIEPPKYDITNNWIKFLRKKKLEKLRNGTN